MYISIAPKNKIQVFDQAGDLKAPFREFGNQMDTPTGLFVDQKQNLWVANFGTQYAGYLLVFPHGSSKLTRRIVVPAQYGGPTMVYVDPNEAISTVGCYEQGCGIARRTPDGKWSNISDPDISLPAGIVGDGLGDLFVSGFSQVLNGAIVEMLPKGKSTWRGMGFPYFAAPGADSTRNVYSYMLSLQQLQDLLRLFACQIEPIHGSFAIDATITSCAI